MYITYCQNQKSLDLVDTTHLRLNAKGGKDYRPTWLIRVSDWKTVSGKEAKNGYCTISYCWEQSGEVVKKNDGSGEYDLVDNAEHCIVYGYDINKDRILSSTKEGAMYVNVCQAINEDTAVFGVEFEGVLQQICTDFDIDYIWYDKVCINQSDKAAKIREIKQMHNIYKNARYAVALVPEIMIYDPDNVAREDFRRGTVAMCQALDDITQSRWWKRSWTLEEVMSSQRILFVGTNTHFWKHSLHDKTCDAPTTVDSLSDNLLNFACQGEKEGTGGSVNQALYEAHFRTSTKFHDIIFALANTFPKMFDHLDVSYKTDINVTFNTFYKSIASTDYSILCFGSNLNPEGDPRRPNTMHDFKLPSWTGAPHGLHIPYPVTGTIAPTTKYVIDDQMKLHVSTKHYWKIPVTKYKYGCLSSSLSKKTVGTPEYIQFRDRATNIQTTRANDQWTSMPEANMDTIQTEWYVNLNIWTNCNATHYHDPQQQEDGKKKDKNKKDVLSGIKKTQLRPLSLTEDCDECFVLPILLKTHKGVHDDYDEVYPALRRVALYHNIYLLPVVKKCNTNNKTAAQERYKSIGIYVVGSTTQYADPTFRWNHCVGRDDIHTEKDPKEILNTLFEKSSHDSIKEFIIE
ncbi:hypothetical protein BDA99DRAFT_74504 [Phascolomyces articulosus]|uniref:Heterokaryon incompatibility domain-containing protein n=1 Tax=Phascolomyces articulosus TaxID=60185 RepID=A0AAD5KAB5_9FUNG|nr:hypothetical protein BDA99DRAFT_74504 [Phascolomyces articulosus]